MKLIANIFKGIWATLNFSRRLILNLLFLFILIAIVINIISGEDQVQVEDKSVLRLDLNGIIVEQLTYVDPFEAAISGKFGDSEQPGEILLDDIIDVVNKATQDQQIYAMYLDLQRMHSAHLDKLRDIRDALVKFKAAGKKIYAHGAYYTQAQYYLASIADQVTLHPYGGVNITGFGMYPLYFKEALDKLKVTQHIFRVGTYKSAVEPFIRSDMSPEAKQSNLGWITPLWSQYKSEVAENRGFDVTNFDETFAALTDKMEAAQGDSAKYAIDNQWVDELVTDQQFVQKLIDEVGLDAKGKSFKQVSFEQYLSTLPPKEFAENPFTEKVAVIVAKGQISDGKRKAGAIGGDSTAALLKRARLNDKVKAVVLRIDSGGGSMFASETIRNEVLALKAAGKPVVASMGSVAASGGYWIAASANEIWASPSTITGSIGVFGMIMTFENAANSLGIYSDGVATTELKGQSPFRGIESNYKHLIQMGVEDAYDKFISMVATERNLEKSAVDEVAQGRVWLATQALNFGLIDKLGNKNDAINAAASLANLEMYDVITIEQALTEQEKLVQQLFGATIVQSAVDAIMPEQSIFAKTALNALDDISHTLEAQSKVLGQLNDPNHVYTLCLVCNVSAE
ncbi:signal peptide peptidase SppA [Pseudoalteromonas sp. SCSIO 43201]|uniref:signal peptide peptidase SppA n=1 Tax=Pseudoalteromonas sp. SCSIO 43201 TaxID=2822842 RepID=UPI00207546D6|nr:signal peptide peptidase SppA [Pseudoalteromonas sp. SCSIO 43201]USD27052.1 signal peptide peptidase SppA [Pseudoalteromonas sp. SCSIO 43201]